MKATAAELLSRLPGPATDRWPGGERFTQALKHGTMSVEIYAPIGTDPQQPHSQDELYIVHSGHGEFLLDGNRYSFKEGTLFFVPAGAEHRFENFSEDFATWVVFYGPEGGEKE